MSDYDLTFYLVTDDPSTRIDDPDAELYDTEYEEITLHEIQRESRLLPPGSSIRIVMITPEQFEENRAYVEAGMDIYWEDPE